MESECFEGGREGVRVAYILVAVLLIQVLFMSMAHHNDAAIQPRRLLLLSDRPEHCVIR